MFGTNSPHSTIETTKNHCTRNANRRWEKCQTALEKMPKDSDSDVISVKLPSNFTDIAKENH